MGYLKDYTTKVAAEQTISEIQGILSAYDVNAMMTEYDGRQVSAVSFRIRIEGNDYAYRLPCNWRAVREVFKEQGITQGMLKHPDRDLDNQAIRTAWRLVKEWVDAQIALVQVNIVTIPQVFLPYSIMKDGRTLAEHIEERPDFLLRGSQPEAHSDTGWDDPKPSV